MGNLDFGNRRSCLIKSGIRGRSCHLCPDLDILCRPEEAKSNLMTRKTTLKHDLYPQLNRRQVTASQNLRWIRHRVSHRGTLHHWYLPKLVNPHRTPLPPRIGLPSIISPLRTPAPRQDLRDRNQEMRSLLIGASMLPIR